MNRKRNFQGMLDSFNSGNQALTAKKCLFGLWLFLKELQCFKFNQWKKTREIFFTAHQNNLIQSVGNNFICYHLMQEWRFLVKSEQSYKFFQFSRKSGVVNSISEKKNETIFFTMHQNNLIQSVA